MKTYLFLLYSCFITFWSQVLLRGMQDQHEKLFSNVLTTKELEIILLLQANGSTIVEGKNGTSVEEMVPLIEPGKEMMLMLNDTRRKLGSFQICALCTCCGSGARGGYCLPTPCCYAISCNIPNRPFGFCSFLPKTCNCFGCHL